jgi:retron-type reverse transcriptase
VIKDRVVQMAVKILVEPIFEADFQDNAYGFRPKRSAHQMVEDVRNHLFAGKEVLKVILKSKLQRDGHKPCQKSCSGPSGTPPWCREHRAFFIGWF